MNATFTWQIPSTATPATETTSSASVLALTDDWSLYVGPVRSFGRATCRVAPPGLDFSEVWDAYPEITMEINGESPQTIDLSTLPTPPDQPASGSITLDRVGT